MSDTFLYGKDHLTVSTALKILRREMEAGIDDEVWQKIYSSAGIASAIAESDTAVYGINTGFGPLCNSRISPEQTKELQTKILLSHSVGIGGYVDKSIAKLMLILKLHALARGYSGVSAAVVERIIWMLDNDIIPCVPAQGSVGASGDLAPLAHLFLPLIGEGFVHDGHTICSSAQVLKLQRMDAVELSAKDGLALINGTQFIAAHAVLLVDEFYNNLWHADLIGTLMLEGLQGSAMPFRSELHQQRPHRANIYTAGKISTYLEGSEIVKSHQDCGRVQDPYSLRCIPQVHGASRSSWLHLKEAVEIEINSVTDNPLVFSEELTISGGNFHGQPLALPIDYACLALSELGSMSDRRIYLSLEGKYPDTPKLLMPNTGLNSGFMMLQYSSAALASENKGLCFPASADSIPTSLGQEDHVSMGAIAARKALTVGENTKKILAIEMICAAQAFDFRHPLKSGRQINEAHQLIRRKIRHTEEDRIFSNDIDTAIQLIAERHLYKKIEKEHHGLYEVY